MKHVKVLEWESVLSVLSRSPWVSKTDWVRVRAVGKLQLSKSDQVPLVHRNGPIRARLCFAAFQSLVLVSW